MFPDPLQTPSDLSRLQFPVDIDKQLGYVLQALTLTRHRLQGRVPLIGFTGAPWTLMAYMIEGQGSKTLSRAKSWLYRHPDTSHHLLSLLTEAVADFLVAQARAGAQMLQVFESSAEYLGPALFEQFALPCIREISSRVKRSLAELNLDVPITIFAKGAHYAVDLLGASGYDVVGLDWTVDPGWARSQLNRHGVACQGNLDPCTLYAPKESLEALTREMLEKFGGRGYIANLGHGIYPDMDPESVQIFVDTVHKFSTETKTA